MSPDTFAAYLVEDAAIDPFRLSLENITQSIDRGGRLMLHTQVTGFTMRGRRIQSATVLNSRSGDTMVIEADQIINAGGAWAGEIAAMAGVSIDILYSKGSLLITDNRLATRVINRLRPSSDADILVPGGTVSILGTTSIRIDSLDVVRPRVDEMDYIIDTASGMVPELKSTRYIRAYAGVRPLVGSRSMDDDRAVSRGWALIDHDPGSVLDAQVQRPRHPGIALRPGTHRHRAAHVVVLEALLLPGVRLGEGGRQQRLVQGPLRPQVKRPRRHQPHREQAGQQHPDRGLRDPPGQGGHTGRSSST